MQTFSQKVVKEIDHNGTQIFHMSLVDETGEHVGDDQAVQAFNSLSAIGMFVKPWGNTPTMKAVSFWKTNPTGGRMIDIDEQYITIEDITIEGEYKVERKDFHAYYQLD